MLPAGIRRGRRPGGPGRRIPLALFAWATATALTLAPVLLPRAAVAEPVAAVHTAVQGQPEKPPPAKPRGKQISKWYQDPIGKMAYQARKTAGLDRAYGRNLVIGFVDITGLDDVDTTGYRVVETQELKQSDPALYKSLGLAKRPQVQRFVIMPTFNNPSTTEVGGAHSEVRFFAQELLYMGVTDRSRTFLLYSDLSPCDACAPKIPENTEVRWMTKQGSGSYQRRERILNAAAAQDHEANMTDADRERNAKAVARTRQKTLEKRAREAQRKANLFGKTQAKDCPTPLAAPLQGRGVLAQAASRHVMTAADCAEQDEQNAPSGLARALAGPVPGAPGGIDFSSLQLRYLSDPGDGSGVQYAFSADGNQEAGDTSPATGVTAGEQSSDAFFVWLELNPSAFWVNLNPTEPDRIVDKQMGRTDAGRILLQADLQLKKSVGKLIHPDTALGKKFWNSIQGRCASFRTWIVPAPAEVHEDGDKLYILNAPLNVKGESEYLRAKGQQDNAGSCPKQDQATSDHNEDVYRTLILPKLKEAVNKAPEYASLRRVYLSRVAAEWYRDLSSRQKTAYGSLVDHGDISNWTTKTGWQPTDTFDAYVKSYRDGEFKVTHNETINGSRYVSTYTYGGVDFSRVPFRKVSGEKFSSGYAGLSKNVSRSLTEPVAGAKDNTLWLGSPTPKQRAVAAGPNDGITPGGPSGLTAADWALRMLLPALGLVLILVLLAVLLRRRGHTAGAGWAQAGWSGPARSPAPGSILSPGFRPADGRLPAPGRRRTPTWFATLTANGQKPSAPSRPAPTPTGSASTTRPPGPTWSPQAHRDPAPTWENATKKEPDQARSEPPRSAPGPTWQRQTHRAADPHTEKAPDPDPYALHDPARVTQHLARVTHHLDRTDLDSSPADAAMLRAIGDRLAEGRPPTEGERHFLRHHLTMAELMDGGTSYEDALRAALRTHPFARHYTPDVIDRFPQLFNNNWRRAWGMRPR